MKEILKSGQKNINPYRNDLIVALVFSLAVFLYCLLFDECLFHHKVLFFLSLPVILWAGRSIFANAFNGIQKRFLNVDALLASGAATAFIVSAINTFFSKEECPCMDIFYDSAVAIITLALLGKYIAEKKNNELLIEIGKVSDAILQANVFVDGKYTLVPLSKIRVGDRLIAKAGERIPLDCSIEEGVSDIDESFLKRSSSVRKYPGDTVIGGSVNISKDITLKVINTGRASLINKLTYLLEEKHTGTSKNPADRFASFYLPIVLAVCILTFAGWMIFSDKAIGEIANISASVLIIACPCALAIAVPLALRSWMEKFMNSGIILRNLEVIDKIRKTNLLVVDKSGVLTMGKPEVEEVIWRREKSTIGKLKSILFSIERKSESAIDASIADYLSKENNSLTDVKDLEQYETGLRATVNGEIYYVGTEAFIGMINHGRYFKKPDYIIHEVSGHEYFFDDEELEAQVQKMKDAGLLVYLAADSKAIFAIIGLGEGVKKSTAESLKFLRNNGLEVALMTGDSREAAQSVADRLGVKEVYSEVLSFSKADIIRDLQKQGKIVGFAGESAQDAPALAQADTSFVLVSGVDAPIENADTVFLNGDISKISEAITLSGKVHNHIRKNIFWAVIFNVLGIAFAAGLAFALFGTSPLSVIASLTIAAGIIAVTINNQLSK